MSHFSESGVELVIVEDPPVGRGRTNEEALFDALRQAVGREAGGVIIRHLMVGELVHEDYTEEAGVEVDIETLDGCVIYDESLTSPGGLSDRTLLPPARVADNYIPYHGLIWLDIEPDPQIGMAITAKPYLLVRNIEATPQLTEILHPSG